MTPRIVDLSTPLYDGIRGLETEPKATIDTEGYNTTTLHLYSHTGTHMDAPRHFVAGGDAIDEVDLRACVGSADVIDLTATEPNGVIGVEDLAHHESRIGAGARLLLRTDWCLHVEANDFRTHMPRISLELRDVHRALLEGGIVIVEGLCNLHELHQDRVHFVALPLRVRGCDGSPVRAIAIEE